MTIRWFGTPWSQVQETELAHRARMAIYGNKNLDYHNWDHVESMYQYLSDTNEPYDEALDWAVLFVMNSKMPCLLVLVTGVLNISQNRPIKIPKGVFARGLLISK